MESAKLSQQQIALFVIDDSRTGRIDHLPDLNKFSRIIVASRQSNSESLRQILASHSVVDFIPLDFNEVFQRAKQRHLDAMIQFRRWFNALQSEALHWMWWFTQTSFRHSFFDRTFNLYLCYELQIKLKDRYPDASLVCYLYTDNRMTALVQWPMSTELIWDSRKNWSRIRPVISDVFAWIAKSCVRRFKTAVNRETFASKIYAADVCLISGYLPVCWEKKGDHIRDRYFAELPEYLKKKGLKIWQLISPGKRCSLLAGQREPRSIRWDLACILKAFVQTSRYYLMTAFITIRNRRHLQQSWHLKLFAQMLLANSRNFFHNLACYYSFKRLFSRHHPRIVLFYDEVYFFGRVLNLAIKKLPSDKQPITVGMQHGSVSDNQLTYFTDVGDPDLPFPSCDYYFVHNELAKKSYGRFLPPDDQNRIKITGLHRVERNHFSEFARIEERLAGLDNQQPIFLLVGGIPTDMNEICNTLTQLMLDMPLQLVIKPHPSHPFPAKWLADLKAANSGPIWYSEQFNLDEVIRRSDYIISTISTSMLNIITHRKYPIICNFSERFDASQMLSWFKQQADAVVVQSPANLHKAIIRLAGIKPQRPAQFVDKKAIMPPVVGNASMDEIYAELDRILIGLKSNVKTTTEIRPPMSN